MTVAARGRDLAAGARRRYAGGLVAVLVIAWLTSMASSGVVAVALGGWRRLTVGMLGAAGVVMLGRAWASAREYARSASASYLGLASAGDLPRSARQVRGLVRQETAARYGQAALPHLIRRSRASRAVLTAVFVFLLAYFVYADISSDTRPPLIAGIVVTGACVMATRAGRRETELLLQAMENAVGGHTLTASSIRWSPEEYIAWCAAHDVGPYPHRRPELPPETHNTHPALPNRP